MDFVYICVLIQINNNVVITISTQMKQHLIKFSLLILCLLGAPYFSYSFSFYGNMLPVTMNSGLNNNTIYDIHNGKRGFVWFATDMGLSRYDGFRLLNYPLTSRYDSSSQPVLDAVYSISEDTDGLLYLRLLRGIVCFDTNKEVYLSVNFDSSFDTKSITSLYIVSKDFVCVGTSSGLYIGKAVRSENEGEECITFTLSVEPVVKGNISKLCGIGSETLFVSVDNSKVAIYDVISGKVEMLKAEYSKITTLYQHGDYLWICSSRANIECYDLKQQTFHTLHEAGGYSPLQDTYVTDVICLDENTYYVAAWTGLFRLEFDSKDLTKSAYRMDYVEQPYNFKVAKKVTSLLWDDSQRMLWIGTFGGGALKVDFTKDACNRLQQRFNADVTAIEEDMKGCVWIATNKGQVWRSTSTVLSENTSFVPWTKGIKVNENYRIYKDRNGCLWLGDEHAGVLYIDPVTEKVESYKLAPAGRTNFSASIRQFCLDSRNRLWIATAEGLILFDSKGNTSRLVQLEDKGVKVKDVRAVAEDKEGNIWVGTNLGLKRIDVQGTDITLFGSYERDAGLNVSPVNFIYVNSYNQIFASYSDKIFRIDGREKDKVESVFTLMNGLSSGHIFCMVDDQNGNTWLGSNSGIMTIRNDRTTFYDYALFGDCDKVCRLRDGRLLWGNSGELIYFDPLMAKSTRNKSRLVVSELWVNGESVPVGEKRNGQILLTTSPNLQQKFVFDADNNDFTFYFSDLQFGMMQRKIAYRLLPDEAWKIGTLENGISYRHLPVGDYTLQVKLIYPDASEGEMVEMSIRVNTHWWKTGWAYLGYMALFLGILFIVYYYMERKGKKREMHKAREMELKETLSLAKMKQEQKQEIEAMRNQLLTLFVQELRTPLSLIIAPLKEMSQENDLSARILSKVRVAYRNSLGMLDACNQLLAIYTQRPLAEKLEVSRNTADKILDKVVFAVSELVRMNQIDFHYDKKTKKELEIWVDSNRIRFVLHNLLSNAFNHVRLSGSVHLSMQETVNNGVAYCTITVSDSGKSQVKEVRQTVDEELQTDLTGIELGYDVMEQVILFHHGSISLNSEEGTGTEVTVNIPIGKEVLENDPNILFVEEDEPEEVEEAVVPVVEAEVPREVPRPEETVVHIPVETPAVARAKKNLLIVEDHKDIRLYLKVLFGKDYNIIMATNGQEGVDMAIKEQPDLILCDVMMPVKDGFECCKEVKEGLDTCHIPFIMLTAKVEDEDIVRGLELGADDYILKPFTPSILKAKVRNLINGRVNLKQMYTKLLVLPEHGNSETDEGTEEVKMEDPFIASLVKIIEENIREADFNVKRLASDMNMSQPTLYRKVKQSTDLTIIELIRGVRMKKAAGLLKQKVYAVQEVAEMVGYNDIPTFRKHFVDTFGSTPSTYANSTDNS